MTIFLLVYDRHRGKLVSLQRFTSEDRARAESERLRIELDSMDRRLGHEVVLLEAQTEADLGKTHARYFKNLSELASSG